MTTSDHPVVMLEQKLGETWSHLRRARELTTSTLEQLHRDLDSHDSPDTSIVAFGSLARGEFTPGSDVDWTFLVDGLVSPDHFEEANEIGRAIKKSVTKDPGREGSFGTMVFSHDLVHLIGGQDDSNTNTTRRCLMLLESVALGKDVARKRVLRAILKRYLLEDRTFALRQTRYHVPRFMLNDFARYWRTMAVDFAYKRRTRHGKGIALRNLKLRFSRKLLFASAMIASFSCQLGMAPRRDSAQKCMQDKHICVACLEEFLQQTPLEMIAVALLHFADRGSQKDRPKEETWAQAARNIFGSYDRFVGVLSNEEKRNRLEALSPESFESDELVTDLRKESRRFRDGLLALFFDLDDETRELTRFYGVF